MHNNRILMNSATQRRFAMKGVFRMGRIILSLALALASTLPAAAFWWPGQLREDLRDSRTQVRLRAGLKLARDGDTEAIPILIDLLAELPAAQRQPVESLLQDLAGEWAPHLTLVGDDDVARGIRRDAWASWWRRSDGEALLNEFRKRTLTPGDIAKVRPLLAKLSDMAFRVREQAQADLVAYGPPVMPLLRSALKDADLEKRLRIEHCLQAIAKSDRPSLPPVAARLVALRKPAGAVDALLAFLPWTEDEQLAGEVEHALTQLAVRGGKVDPALPRALDDEWPVRRAIAGKVLVGIGGGEHRAVRKLLADPDAAVRLCVALALVCAGDKEAVPALIDLAADLPASHAWQAAELLQHIAGNKGPALEDDNATGHQRHRAAWQKWWEDHAATIDLTSLPAGLTHKAAVQARASNSWDGHTPDRAFVGDRQTYWNAGGHAPQWLEADLGTSVELGSIHLVVAQLPAGQTTHEIWVSDQPIGEDRAKAKLVHSFQGQTDNAQALEFRFPKMTFARHVQIRTTESPSWVGWLEVQLRVGRPRFSFARISQ
jgi:HEAT repeat protein